MQGKHSVGAPTAGVLVQIERIIDAALQDARTHIALHPSGVGYPAQAASNADDAKMPSSASNTVMRLQKYLLSVKSILEAARGKSESSPAKPGGAVSQEQDEYTIIPFATAASDSVTDSTRLKEELHKTMDRLSKLKQEMRVGQTKPPAVAKLDLSKVQRDQEGPSGPFSPSQHGTADFVDTGESRLSQMSNIEERLMGMDHGADKDSEHSVKKVPSAANSQPSRQLSSHSGSPAPAQSAPAPNVLNAASAASVSVAPTTGRHRPTLVPGERLDKETMNKWCEIFSHRTRPQHPDSTRISMLPVMDHVQLPPPVINVKEQHKDREHTLNGQRRPTVFVAPGQPSMYRAQDSGRHSPSVNSHSAQLQQHHHTSQQPSSNWQYVQGPNGSYYAVISPAHDAGRQTQQQPQRSSVYTSHSTSGHLSNSRAGGSPAAPYKPPPGRIDSRMMVSSAASASSHQALRNSSSNVAFSPNIRQSQSNPYPSPSHQYSVQAPMLQSASRASVNGSIQQRAPSPAASWAPTMRDVSPYAYGGQSYMAQRPGGLQAFYGH